MSDIVSVPRLDPAQVETLKHIKSFAVEVAQTKDFESGFKEINRLHEHGKTFAMGIGILLESMDGVWKPSEHEGESFYSATRRETGLSPITVKRHVKIQQALESGVIPNEYKEQIVANHGEKSLIQIAELVVGGYEVKDEDWRDLAEAPDDKEVGRISRKVKNVEPRSNWLAISIDGNGRLFVHTTRGVNEIGRLYIQSDNEDVQKAIARITGCAAIQPASEY